MAKKTEEKAAETAPVSDSSEKTTPPEETKVEETPPASVTEVKNEAAAKSSPEVKKAAGRPAADTKKASETKKTTPSATKVVDTAKIQPKTTAPTPAPVVLEPGRAICHESFYDGRVRRITAMDEPEFSGQHHYMLEIQETDANLGIVKKVHREDINFQKGPLQIVGPNGWTEADLVKILIDRLTNFTQPGVAQPENEQALKGLREAHAALDKRRKRKIEEREKTLAAARKAKASPVKPVIY